MEVIGGRRVRSGKEYEHLFPRPTGKDETIKKSAEVSDTVKFIQENTPKVAWQTRKFAKHLITGRSLNEKSSQLWHFVFRHIPYKRDEDGVEQVRSPRRVWHDRNKVDSEGKVGVDCDCYTVFISATLMNLRIPHKYRITKYPKEPGETPRWQHIYVVVPKDGKMNYELDNRNDYIVLDCVKDRYDDEEPFLEYRDYDADMRLDYLDGLDGEETYEVPNLTDVQDIAALYDEEELGKIGQWLKKTVKKVGDAAGKVIRKINKINPATLVLRNAFLLGMKVNFMNVPKRLRYAYLSDDEARKRGMNLAELAKLRKVRDKAETIYWQAGGQKDKLKLAILKGKGNRDSKVPLAGLGSITNFYADQDEYNIIHNTDSVTGLGAAPAAGGLAVITPFFAAIAATLKEVKGLFPKGGGDSMESDQDVEATQAMQTVSEASLMQEMEEPIIQQQQAPANMTLYRQAAQTPATNSSGSSSSSASTEMTTTTDTTATPTEEKPSLFKNPIAWAKKNPIPAGLILLGAGYVGYRLIKKNNTGGGSRSSGGGLSGLPSKKKRRKTKSKTKGKKKKNNRGKGRVRAIVI